MDIQLHNLGQFSTWFAPAARVSAASLKASIEEISHNALINVLMQVINGFLAVLNEQRQVLAVNDNLLQYLGVGNTGALLGLRPGEILNCIHAHDEPGGCGTSKACQTCGAVIAMVASLAGNHAVQSNCFLTIEKDGKPLDLYFQVNCSPIAFDDKRYLILFLRDTTINQRRAALERCFFHDMNNIVGALVTTCELMERESDPAKIKKMSDRIGLISARIMKELDLQRTLTGSTAHNYEVVYKTISIRQITDEIMDLFLTHEASRGKILNSRFPEPDMLIETDPILLERILINMLINAFEATEDGNEVRLWTESSAHDIVFHVWNSQAIPAAWIPRIFQRNFSTKPGSGRGLGTYVTKLFGESYLGGTVQFTTSAENGTTFSLHLPVKKTSPL